MTIKDLLNTPLYFDDAGNSSKKVTEQTTKKKRDTVNLSTAQRELQLQKKREDYRKRQARKQILREKVHEFFEQLPADAFCNDKFQFNLKGKSFTISFKIKVN